MKEKIIELIKKYREFLVYFIVGCLTTIVAAIARFGFNFLFFGGALNPTALQNTILTIVDWVAGVAFAYPTNRKWVFQSKNPNILAELGGFVASRLATLGMDWAVTQILGTLLGINVYITWFIKSVLVFLGNYILSKVFVFKKKSAEPEKSEDSQKNEA